MLLETKSLIISLDQLVTVYRHLLDLVRKENAVLLEAQLEELAELNPTKEKLIGKIKELESVWTKKASLLCRKTGLSGEPPTLKKIAQTVGQDQGGEKLLRLHSVLSMLVHRIAEMNGKNELLTQSALSHITGAMQAITDTLKEHPTYKSGGDMRGDTEGTSGRLIAKQV